MSTRIGFVSLGCPKALVDSERIISRLRAEGYELSPSYQGADAVIVNTCGFLDSARAESLDAIGEALNENGRVIVTGCLGVDEHVVRDAHPDVLAVTGPGNFKAVMEAVHQAVAPPHDPFLDLIPAHGIRLTPRHYAYLKISEGCNHRCSFCIIPRLRGDLVSRPIGDVLTEAERLVNAGVKEILVISQDTSAYGVDLRYAPSEWRGQRIAARMTELCQALGTLGAWIRLHYVYPYPHVDELIPLMAEGALLPYLDIPFQHAAPRILKAMKRPAREAQTLAQIRAWREAVPDLTIRSTFIVGFPGETDQDFQYLLDWLEDAQLDRVGCFRFEPVTTAAANRLPDPVAEDVKEERWHRLMEAQRRISAARLQSKVGATISVLIDQVKDGAAIGRSSADAPEVDGQVLLADGAGLRPGDLIEATIVGADDYDLHGVQVVDSATGPARPGPA